MRQIAFLAHINRETVPQILTEELNVRKVCAKLDSKKFDQRTEGNSRPRLYGVVRKFGYFQSCDNRLQKLDFCVQSWNATAESGVEDTRGTSNKESGYFQIANESHDRHILWLSRYNFGALGNTCANWITSNRELCWHFLLSVENRGKKHWQPCRQCTAIISCRNSHSTSGINCSQMGEKIATTCYPPVIQLRCLTPSLGKNSNKHWKMIVGCRSDR